MRYKQLNNLVGWGVFIIALVTYSLTVSPTASFWDCGEFIACAYELEVPHPPGAPLFLLVGRILSMFAPSPESVAFMVNMVSVLSSAFMALFITWTTTMLAQRVLAPDSTTKEPDFATAFTILASGAIAGLTCTFIDTVWFNAVEAEVYAMSSMFTTAVFWLALKWEARADNPGNLRWIILIAYLVGLSVGVHLLPLLAIPAVVLLYYFRKFKTTTQGIFIAIGIFIGIVVVVQIGVIQKTWDVAWAIERLFVGTKNPTTGDTSGFGLPYGSGALFFAILLLGGIVAGIWYAHKTQRTVLHTALMSILLIYLGFSSYTIILVRSNADPAIDQNHPANAAQFLSYVKREQYGESSLLYGPYYNAQVRSFKDGSARYRVVPGEDRYIFDGYRREPVYDPAGLRFFPRMHNPSHYASGPFGYQRYVSNKGQDPNNPADDKPTGLDNLAFFFDYQVGHMYFRYLFWNYVGRSDDDQHSGWESGLEFGRFKNMPDDIKHAPTRNHYYALPLLLGLFGLIWHFMHDKKRAWVVTTLWFMTGLAIVLYLNQVAQEPRERDYAFVGSFHTFAIWVGLGVCGLVQLLQGVKALRPRAHFVAGGLALFMSPVLLVKENWNDHSRAGRFVAPDTAYNLLNSCEPNAIIFTNGDNDTFPLWYLQEVEGIRTDVRVVNLSLLNTDWYIYQLKYKTWNDAPPVPISLPESWYMGEKNGSLPWQGQSITFEVPRDAIAQQGFLNEEELAQMDSSMTVRVDPRMSGNYAYLQKQDVLVLDILTNIAKAGWERPIYFANTVGPSNYLGLQPYFRLEGLAYRILPVREPDYNPQGIGRIHKEKMTNLVLNEFRYRNLNNPDVFFGETIERMVNNLRNSVYQLAEGYIQEAAQLEAAIVQDSTSAEENDPRLEEVDRLRAKAIEVLDFSQEAISEEALKSSVSMLLISADMYSRAGAYAKMEEILTAAYARMQVELPYLEGQEDHASQLELRRYYGMAYRIVNIYQQQQNYAEAAKWAEMVSSNTLDPAVRQEFQNLYQQIQLQMGNAPSSDSQQPALPQP